MAPSLSMYISKFIKYHKIIKTNKILKDACHFVHLLNGNMVHKSNIYYFISFNDKFGFFTENLQILITDIFVITLNYRLPTHLYMLY